MKKKIITKCTDNDLELKNSDGSDGFNSQYLH